MVDSAVELVGTLPETTSVARTPKFYRLYERGLLLYYLNGQVSTDFQTALHQRLLKTY